MAKLILLRHGQSVWNKKNIFTGFEDVELSEQGVREAKLAGKKLAQIEIDCVFTSVLKRAIETAKIALQGRMPEEYFENAALNERHYGSLQGCNKDEMREKFGAEQVHIWRRSFDQRPPDGESLKDTCDRVLPYFQAKIFPMIAEGKNILVAAHGNSLRALIMHLEKLSSDEIVKVEIPTGMPIVYEFDDKNVLIKKEVLS